MKNNSQTSQTSASITSIATADLSGLKHHPLREMIFGKEWQQSAIQRARSELAHSSSAIEILPDGTVIFGGDDFNALVAAGAKEVNVVVRKDLAELGGEAVLERLAKDTTYKGFQSPVEQFKCELAQAGCIELLEQAAEGGCLCDDCLADRLGHLNLSNASIMFQACCLRAPLSHLVHAGLMSPAVAASIAFLPASAHLELAEVLALLEREAAGSEFTPDEAITIDHAAIQLLADFASADSSEELDSLVDSRAPLSKSEVIELWDCLEEGRNDTCDRSLTYTTQFLEERELPVEEVLDWLADNGGNCDCEVLLNVCYGPIGMWALEEDEEDQE